MNNKMNGSYILVFVIEDGAETSSAEAHNANPGSIKSRAVTDRYRSGWDGVFGAKTSVGQA